MSTDKQSSFANVYMVRKRNWRYELYCYYKLMGVTFNTSSAKRLEKRLTSNYICKSRHLTTLDATIGKFHIVCKRLLKELRDINTNPGADTSGYNFETDQEYYFTFQ